jgi:hypothetical protein
MVLPPVSLSCYQSIVMLFIVWQNRHHEALLTQSNNCKLAGKTMVSLSKHYSDAVYLV